MKKISLALILMIVSLACALGAPMQVQRPSATKTPQTQAPESMICTVQAPLHVRSEPDWRAAHVAYHQSGDVLNLSDVSDGWGKVSQGWINLMYCK
jgi:hypothetical protein